MKKTILFLILALILPSNIFSQGGSGGQSVTLFYVATAVDSSGNESAFSNETSATVSAAHNKVNLTWAESGTVSGFNMYRAKVSGGPYTKINTALIPSTSYTDTVTFPASPTGLSANVP